MQVTTPVIQIRNLLDIDKNLYYYIIIYYDV